MTQTDELTWDERVARGAELYRSGVRGRYAPSPTGPLHLGNVRTALIAWLQARLEGGAFIMRMENLDEPRSVEGSAEQIMEDLYWLGLDWEEGPDVGGAVGSYTQSERTAIYEDALARLRERGRIFECYCSRKDIREAVSAPHDAAPVYPGTCRHLDEAERQAVEEEKGFGPAWRFLVGEGVTFEVIDRVKGAFAQDLTEDVGDFVVKRRDGLFAYQLAVVVDDALMGVTDVVRGEDLLSSTPRQVALYEILGLEVPRFWHVPMMEDEDGERMSKRDGSESLQEWRERGASAEEVVGHLAASLGWAESGEALSARALLERVEARGGIAYMRETLS